MNIATAGRIGIIGGIALAGATIGGAALAGARQEPKRAHKPFEYALYASGPAMILGAVLALSVASHSPLSNGATMVFNAGLAAAYTGVAALVGSVALAPPGQPKSN